MQFRHLTKSIERNDLTLGFLNLEILMMLIYLFKIPEDKKTNHDRNNIS